MTSLIMSRSTGELLFVTGSRCSPSPSPSSIVVQLLRRRGARRALHELLADQRLRPDRAARVRLPGGEVVVVDAQHDGRLLVVGHLQRVHDAHRRAGDLHVLALHERGGVVEDRAHEVGVVAVLLAGGVHHADHEPRHDGHGEGYPDEPSHGPGGVWDVEQSLPAGAGLEPSGAGWMIAPGQRVRLPVSKPLSFWLGLVRRERAAREVGRQEHRLHAGVVAVGVVVGGQLAEVREPGREVGRVAARVLEHRLRPVERLDRAREHGGGEVGQLRLLRGQLDQVVVRAGLAHERVEVGDRRARVVDERPQLREEGRELASCPASRRPRACRGRRASSAGSRTWCWPCAACPGGGRARATAPRSRRRSPRRSCWRS